MNAIERALADWQCAKRSRDNWSTATTEASLKAAQSKLRAAVLAECSLIVGDLPPLTVKERIARNRARRNQG